MKTVHNDIIFNTEHIADCTGRDPWYCGSNITPEFCMAE